MSEIYQIAIDGPSGSGKSTLAKGVSKVLGIMYLDTGAMYRTCGLSALKRGISPRDEDAVKKMQSQPVIIDTYYGDGHASEIIIKKLKEWLKTR